MIWTLLNIDGPLMSCRRANDILYLKKKRKYNSINFLCICSPFNLFYLFCPPFSSSIWMEKTMNSLFAFEFNFAIDLPFTGSYQSNGSTVHAASTTPTSYNNTTSSSGKWNLRCSFSSIGRFLATNEIWREKNVKK